MYQPISFNVIRQALHWHGFPTPNLRQLSHSPSSEDGISTAEYLATWGYSLIDDFYRHKSCKYPSRADNIQQDVQDCFTGDVCVLGVGWMPATRCYFALLYIQVDEKVEAWSRAMDCPW